VSLDLYPGEIHTLLGENGAGKSTLIKIMTGIYQPDEGQMLLDGAPIEIRNSAHAQQHGIAAIYQEPMIFSGLNVAENIFISHHGRGALVNWNQDVRGSRGDTRQAGRADRCDAAPAREDCRWRRSKR
jgi:rhamnose transport system ATP-binding protein